ncbi:MULTISPECIES: hypothetical protein [Streptomyces]|uniref:hypothetical protein n=1 Tax=Streptomyces TaxID=1883 RepID=UPI00081E9BF3|nr:MULTISPECIES: hypothetical protein [unclassified Streptomyces]MYQ96033.1 hypothetical protein [Streptomyces sp. SID4946]SCF95216.1 hypothetical protein GA0115258_118559 [Streptomyces sp. LamerLS-31b]SCF98882.1 hypothetical protein GA0115256_139516 [Streptomyces sp. DconLS]
MTKPVDRRGTPWAHRCGSSRRPDLEEAAQRCGRELSGRREEFTGFPDPEPGTGGTEFHSWRKIAEWLARVGDDVPETPPDLIVADRALRLADALEGADVPPGTLRALGLPVN